MRPCSKAGGICAVLVVEKQAGQLAPYSRRNRGLILEHDGVAVAALDDGIVRDPAASVLEKQNAHGLRRLEVRFPHHLAQRVAELFETNHRLAAALAGVGQHLERARRELDPVILGGEETREQDEERQPPHSSSIMPRDRSDSGNRRDAPESEGEGEGTGTRAV